MSSHQFSIVNNVLHRFTFDAGMTIDTSNGTVM